MNDTILLTLPIKEFETLVADAFKAYRDGHVLELSTLPLASSTLVEACFLSGEPVTPDVRGRAMQAVLDWAVDRLRPSGEHKWTATNWRPFNILHHFYLQGMRASDLAERMSIVEQTLYTARPLAFAAVAEVLRKELATPQDLQGRKRYYAAGRYAHHPPHEQRILRLAAIFRHPLPLALIERLLDTPTLRQTQPPAFNLADLIATHLLLNDDEHTTIFVHPEARSFLLTMLSAQERRTWHALAAEFYQEQQDHLEAATHFYLAGMQRSAAEVIIKHHRAIINNLQMEDLRDFVGGFQPSEISKTAWARLRIIAGQVAEAMQDVETAAAEYGQALGAEDIEIKALAYYQRAKVLELKNVDQALAHYHYCIQFLESVRPSSPLLPKAYIGRAWIFIQERQDLVKAEANLSRAQQRVDRADRETWSHLHNAWGELTYHKRDLAKAIEHHLQGWLAASEVQNVDIMLNSLHNVGTIYSEMGQYQQGLEYLLKCQSLAVQAGNRRMESLSTKSIGACYFWLADYRQAIHYYLLAREIFIEMGNRNWQAGNCYDLAEAFAEMDETASARQYFDEGVAISQELGLDRFLQGFDDLTRRYPGLAPPSAHLSERQLQILEFSQAHQSITSKQCQQLTGVSREQAIRDINDMIDKGFLIRLGQARSTRYVLKGY